MFLISAVLLIIRTHLLVCNMSQECIRLGGFCTAHLSAHRPPLRLGDPQTQHEGPEVCSPKVARHWPLRASSFMVFDYKNGNTTFLKLIFPKFLENLTVGTLCKEKGEFLVRDGAWLTLQTKDADWMKERLLGECCKSQRNGKFKNAWKGCLCVHMCMYMRVSVGMCVYWEDLCVLWPVNFDADTTRELEWRVFSAFNPLASGLY